MSIGLLTAVQHLPQPWAIPTRLSKSTKIDMGRESMRTNLKNIILNSTANIYKTSESRLHPASAVHSAL